ncbi:hypothetical protein E8E11_003209 [Didymella keratinophila]|nr:hypothetical protein E8E11_003209 [Didymella keratinophila]
MSQVLNATNNPLISMMVVAVVHRVCKFAIMLQTPNVTEDEGLELEVFNKSETDQPSNRTMSTVAHNPVAVDQLSKITVYAIIIFAPVAFVIAFTSICLFGALYKKNHDLNRRMNEHTKLSKKHNVQVSHLKTIQPHAAQEQAQI